MATNKVQTGTRFEAELLYKMAYIAKKNKRSLNAQTEFLAERCVEEFEKSISICARVRKYSFSKTPFCGGKCANSC